MTTSQPDDVDLATEELYDDRGNRVTREYAELAREALEDDTAIEPEQVLYPSR